VRSIRMLVALAAAAVSSGATSSFGAGRVAGDRGNQGASQEPSTEKQLEDIDKRWLHAATIQDTDFLKQFFADGMFEVQRGGVVESGEGMRKALGTPGRHVQIDIDDVVVRGVYGDTAIITDRTTQEGTAADGRKVSGEYTVMRVLRRQDGKWRAIGAQMTPLKPSTSAPPVTDLSGGKIETSSAEKELIDLDRKWVDAATNGDTDFLKRLFGGRMFEVQADGHVATVAEMLKAIGVRKPGQFEGYCDQIQVHGIYGDTAILTDRRVLKGRAADGRDINAQWRVTRVLVKQDGKWRAVASALTTIDQS
jgi:ketosteroid isomerase-like protein